MIKTVWYPKLQSYDKVGKCGYRNSVVISDSDQMLYEVLQYLLSSVDSIIVNTFCSLSTRY